VRTKEDDPIRNHPHEKKKNPNKYYKRGDGSSEKNKRHEAGIARKGEVPLDTNYGRGGVLEEKRLEESENKIEG